MRRLIRWNSKAGTGLSATYSAVTRVAAERGVRAMPRILANAGQRAGGGSPGAGGACEPPCRGFSGAGGGAAPRRPAAGLSASVALLLACACGGAGDQAGGEALAESFVLITLDTTRADALGALGGPPGLTPELDALARASLGFTNARSVAPLTLPAHASMLTGLYPPRHTLRTNALYALPSGARTLAERCAEAGLETAAFVAAAVLDARYGLDQGFDVYDAPALPAVESSTHATERPASEVLAAAEAWLRTRESGRPFFLWVHLFDPHAPYQPSPSGERRAEALDVPAASRPYYGEIADVDTAVGGFLDELDRRTRGERLMVLLTADHGEGLDEHDELTHATLCYDSTLRVPLFVRYPLPGGDAAGARPRAGERSDAIVSVVDVFPTALGALGLQAATDIDGVDLLADDPRPDRGVYFESYDGYVSYGWSPLAGWADAAWKYQHSSRPLAFDPVSDPGELLPRAADPGDPAFERYRRALAAIAARPTLAEEAASGGEAAQAQLRALGYTGAGASSSGLPLPLDDTHRPSPLDRTRDVKAIQAAAELQNAGMARSDPKLLGRAAELLEELVERNPDATRIQERLALCLGNLGQHERAADLYRVVLAATPGQGKMHNNLAICYFNLGQNEDALREVQTALEIDPNHGEALRFVVHLLGAMGRAEEAAPYAQRLENLGSD